MTKVYYVDQSDNQCINNYKEKYLRFLTEEKNLTGLINSVSFSNAPSTFFPLSNDISPNLSRINMTAADSHGPSSAFLVMVASCFKGHFRRVAVFDGRKNL